MNSIQPMPNPWLHLPSIAPYVPPCDHQALDVFIKKLTPKGKSDHAINLESIPEPFIGNPESASVLLLSLNPGDDPKDAAAHKNPEFREALLCNLRHGSQLYPFYALHPEFERTGCGDYWTRHLRWLLEHPLLNRKCIAERLLVVDWFPYHSKKSGVPKSAILPSQSYVFEMVRQAIGKKLIVGLRAKARWRGVDPRLADVPYLRSPQASYVSPNNCGEEVFNKIVEALKC